MITLNNNRYNFRYTVRMYIEICKKYGSFVNFTKALTSENDVERLENTMWAVRFAANEAIASENHVSGKNDPPLSEEDFEMLSPGQITKCFDELVRVINEDSAPAEDDGDPDLAEARKNAEGAAEKNRTNLCA